ncbi:HAD-IIIC family phosphatase [Micromonospora sp. CA-246542]|uniref:HAD-IIIC family phosphatase n=1 Tax=Micromonospora sp. CA-246542 TaxID=3239959 RepID=UPI003D8B4A3A
MRVAVLASHTTDFYVELLPVAALAADIDLAVHQMPFGMLEQSLLPCAAELIAFAPDYVVLAGTAEDLRGVRQNQPAEEVVQNAVERWTGLWTLVREQLHAKVVQHTFVPTGEDPYGNAAAGVPEAPDSVVAAVNAQLWRRGAGEVLFVDCSRLAARFGIDRWRDPRFWGTLRQPVTLNAVGMIAQATAGVIAADLGLTKRCVVVDLDNTLWDGVIGEDGFAGVAIGTGHRGEAFAAFQDYLSGLRSRGMALAVASKNDFTLVKEAFTRVPGMRLHLDDFAVVVADWRPKSQQLADIAARMRLGVESLAFVDDNPAECAEVSAALPQVDVVALPADPATYVSMLRDRPTLAAGVLTLDDHKRAASYQALEQAQELRRQGGSLTEFLDGLQMRSRVRRLDEAALARAVQLLQKTNQFNLTTRRHSLEELTRMARDPGWGCYTLSLSDRFADHGIVGLLLLEIDGAVGRIDTLLLSCRVIGRTAERRLLALGAADAGCDRLVGWHIPTERNGLVRELYPQLGFVDATDNGRQAWIRDGLADLDSPHIFEERE